jgi:hypothetical protein
MRDAYDFGKYRERELRIREEFFFTYVIPPTPSPDTMSDQESRRQDNQLELQQHNEQAFRQISAVVATILYHLLSRRLTQLTLERRRRIPYHTSALSGADWVHELLSGHPERIRVELGVYRSTFTILLKAMEKCGVTSSRHVSIEEQLSIFLYTVVTGLPCTHVGERFQRSSSTITK